MIIENLGPTSPEEDHPGGLRNYRVRVNREPIASFQHYREDGLADCLRLAAEAIDEARAKGPAE